MRSTMPASISAARAASNVESAEHMPYHRHNRVSGRFSRMAGRGIENLLAHEPG